MRARVYLNGNEIDPEDLRIWFDSEQALIKLMWQNQIIFEKGVKEDAFTLELKRDLKLRSFDEVLYEITEAIQKEKDILDYYERQCL